MLKQLNKKLLENYPLLWNMRVVPFIFIILAVHLLHLLFGYISFSDIEHMQWHRPESMFFSTPFAFFSIIGSFVILILWLVRYSRNNAFKSFYPFSNGRLFAEFLLLFFIVFLNISYYYSYTLGYVFHARTATNFTMAQKDRELYNKMAPFLEENKESYNLERRCFPAPFPLQKRYLKDNVGKDSAAYVIPSAEGNVLYVDSKEHLYTREELQQLTGGFPFSYLNYCDYHESDTGPTNRELLQRGDAKEVRTALEDFLKMCDRYHIRYRIEADEWFRWIYNPPYYPVKYTLRSLPDYDNTNFDDEALLTTSEYNPNGFYLQSGRLETILSNTFRVHEYHIETESFCVFLYCALGFAILVYSFRVTSRRIWLISLIGICLFSLVIGAFSALLISGRNSGISVLAFYLVLILLFLVVALASRNKTISGVGLTWFMWTAPFLLPIISGFLTIRDRSEWDYVNGVYQEPPLARWLSDHYALFLLLCVIIYILIMLALTAVCRRWQAMAED